MKEITNFKIDDKSYKRIRRLDSRIKSKKYYWFYKLINNILDKSDDFWILNLRDNNPPLYLLAKNDTRFSYEEIQTEAERLVKAGTYSTIGEALFNLDLGSGNYSCARCHTKGWSYGDPQITGGGGFGPNLTGGSAVRQFPQKSDMVSFIQGGSEYGKRYGEQGQGSGRMPAFGAMLTDEQISAVVDYVRGL